MKPVVAARVVHVITVLVSLAPRNLIVQPMKPVVAARVVHVITVLVSLAPRNLIVQPMKPVVAASVVLVLTVVGILVARAMIAALDRGVARIPAPTMVVMTLPPPLLSL